MGKLYLFYHLHLAPPQGVIPVEFRGDLWHPKTRFSWLSCGFVCVILRLSVLVELPLVADRQTDTGPWLVPRMHSAVKNSYHVLYTYLPESQYQHYRLRQRPHNKALIPKATYLSIRDYIRRMLHKYCYSPTVTPCCDIFITHCACVCYCRDVWFFICFTVAFCIILAYIVFSFVDFSSPRLM